MRDFDHVTKCPYCGGELIISDHYSFTRDYRITKDGVLSRRYTVSDPGPMDCTTAYCLQCKTAFDADMISVESDGKVYLRI